VKPTVQFPPDAKTLARRLAALERQMRELRAAKRAAATALGSGSLSVVDSSGTMVAQITPNFGDGRSAVAAFQQLVGQQVYAALAGAELRFGVTGQSTVDSEGNVSFEDLGDGRNEVLVSSGNQNGAEKAFISLTSGSYIGSDDSGMAVTADEIALNGLVRSGNVAMGLTLVTPSAANAPTSVSLSGFSLPGTAFTAFATAQSSVPGSQVTGVGITNATATSATLWLTRTNTTATGVYWMVRGQ
jgi:DNA-binding transcriptional LysR family regulator